MTELERCEALITRSRRLSLMIRALVAVWLCLHLVGCDPRQHQGIDATLDEWGWYAAPPLAHALLCANNPTYRGCP